MGLVSTVLISLGLLGSLLGRPGQEERSLKATAEASVREVFFLPSTDSLNSVHFIAEFELPNPCFDLGRTSLQVDRQHRVILLHQDAYQARTDCSNEKVLTSKLVEVGKVPPGTYDIRALKDFRKLTTLQVPKATEVKSDNLLSYVSVNSAEIHNDTLGFRRMMTVKGFLSNACIRFQSQPGFQFKKASNGVVEITPRVERLPSKAVPPTCAGLKVPFLKTIEIPDSLASGRYLFHIRAAKDRSLDRIDYVQTDVQLSRRIDGASIAIKKR